MSDLAVRVQQEITEAAAKDELELPTLPEVALKIRDAAEDANATVTSLAPVIAEDPSIAAQILRAANSPAFRAANPIEDLSVAVGRLGISYTTNLATGLAMRNMFQATSEMVDDKMRQIWAHATDVAGMANVLASSLASLPPDQAALAGLTHSIGALPVLAWAEEHEDLIPDAKTLDRVIESVQGSLGTMILQSWDFPEEMALVPAQLLTFDRDVPKADYIDVVQVAHLQTLVNTPHPYSQLDWHTVQAIPRLGLNPDNAADTLKDFNEAAAIAKELWG